MKLVIQLLSRPHGFHQLVSEPFALSDRPVRTLQKLIRHGHYNRASEATFLFVQLIFLFREGLLGFTARERVRLGMPPKYFDYFRHCTTETLDLLSFFRVYSRRATKSHARSP